MAAGTRLKGKRVVITGAGAGMGRAGALMFAREGARVLAVDVNGDALEDLVHQADGEALDVGMLQTDLSDPMAPQNMIRVAAEKFKGLDILWSHAGMNGPPSLEGLDMADYDKTLSLNLTASVRACSETIPLMREAGGGAIVLTSSVAGLVGSVQSPVYSATKFALVGLAKSLALKYASEKIRVNAICPGPVNSQMMADLAGGRSRPDGPQIVKGLIGAIPLARLAEPEEIAEAALWLASDAASFVTGIALPVDGGVTAR